MNELPPQGEFHHFQLVSQGGEVPFSISILVHYNGSNLESPEPIGSDEILALHDGLKSFDGDFIKAFAKK